MLLNKIAGKNYFVALIALLALTTILVISAFVVTALVPDALGRTPYEYSISSVCEFEPWTIETPELTAIYPDGGIIITLNIKEYKRSVLLLGEGFYRQGQQEMNIDDTGGLFMVLEHALFEEIRGGNIFTPVEDPEVLEYAAEVTEIQEGVPSIWEDTIHMAFHPQEGLVYYYLLTPEGEPILPPNVKNTSHSIFGSFLIYAIFILIMLLIITIFSLEHRFYPVC